jgi:hypothetical protein
MQFGIRHVLWLVFAIGLALAFVDRVRLERGWLRAEWHCAVAKHRLDELETKLAKRNPNWQSEFQVRREIDLPKPTYDVYTSESTEFVR